MAKVQILADTCCDLTSELKDQFGVATVPLYVVLGEKMYRDGVDIEPRMLYKYFEETQQTPKTSATTVGDYMDFFKPSELSFMGRTGTDRENADLILFLASDEASYISGQNIQIDGCRKKQ